MESRIKEGQWSKSMGKYVFKIHRDFNEANDRYSKCSFNETTGIGMLYLNCRTEFPVNTKKTEPIISKILKHIFNASRYICIINGGNKVKNEDLFFTNIEFHFRTGEFPNSIPEAVSEVEGNLIERLFIRTDKKTGEAKEVQYTDLPVNQRYYIVKYCDNPETIGKFNKKRTFDGAYWEYA